MAKHIDTNAESVCVCGLCPDQRDELGSAPGFGGSSTDLQARLGSPACQTLPGGKELAQCLIGMRLGYQGGRSHPTNPRSGAN